MAQVKDAVVTATLAPWVDYVTARLAIEVTNEEDITLEDFVFTGVKDNVNNVYDQNVIDALNNTKTIERNTVAFFWGPEEGTDINTTVVTEVEFKFNTAGTYNIKIYLIKIQ